MTRTEVDVKLKGPSRRRALLRRLLVLPVALLLVAAPAAPALGASSTNKEGLSGYSHKEEAAKKEPQSSKSKEAPAEEPTKTSAPVKQSTLPFTGFDLRWTVGFGLLLMGAGGSIIAMQRRQRRSGR